MATTEEAIRRLSIQATTTGVAEATGQLERLSDAQSGVAVTSATTEKATLSLDRSFANIERRYVTTVRAQQDLEKVQRQVNAAVSQNPALQERANVILAAAADRYQRATAAAASFAAAQGSGSDNSARAADIAAYGASLDSLRAKFNPLFAAGQQYKATLAEISQAARVGAISEQERAAAVMDSKVAFIAQTNAIRGATGSVSQSTAGVSAHAATVGLAAHQWGNLGFQVNDVVSGLAMGQAPLQIMAQQGGQIYQILSMANGGVGGALKSIRDYMLSLLTVGRLVFGGIGLAITGTVLALNSYLNKQNAVALSLTGAGRASGSTVGSINAIANSGSSITGLSVSQARDLATAVAATGKVADDNLPRIVAMGKDVATAFGVDAKGAADLLAKAFADPVRGADTLNARLGFLSASMRRQIEDLVAQGRAWEAQRVLADAAADSLKDVDAAVASSTKFWTALGNVASLVWDKIGEGAARLSGIGLTKGLDEKIANTRDRIAELEQIASRRSDAVNASLGTTRRIDDEKAKLDGLIQKWNQYGVSVEQAQQRRDSFANAAAIDKQLPAINQVRDLQNDYLRLSLTMKAVQMTGGESSPLLADMSRTYDQLAQSVVKSKSAMDGFKDSNAAAAAALKLQIDAVGAKGPSALGAIAYRQSVQASGRTEDDPAVRMNAEYARTLAIKQAQQQITDAVRARVLSAQQSTEQAGLELKLVGQTSIEQDRQRALLQAKQQLEQDALQTYGNREAYHRKHLQAIDDEINKQAALKLATAKAQINDQIGFDRKTAFLSSDDVQIARTLSGVYDNDVTKALSSVEAQAIRVNNAMRDVSSTMENSMTTGLADIVDGTKSASQGFADMSKAIIRAIEEMVIKMAVIQPLMKGIQSAAGSLGFGGMNAVNAGTATGVSDGGFNYLDARASAKGNVFDYSNVIPFARGGAFSNSIVDRPTLFPFANGTGLMGEAGPEAIVPLKRGSDGSLGIASQGGGNQVSLQVNVINQSSATVTGQATQNADGSFDIVIRDAVRSVIADDAGSNGPITQTMKASVRGNGGR